MNVPPILPDELLAGYRGRLAVQYNWGSITETHAGIIKRFPVDTLVMPGQTTVTHRLAHALGMSLRDLLSQHSMSPLFAAFPDLERDTGWDYCSSRFATVWLRLARPSLAICEECVAQDLKTLNFSYWHRCHQVPGLLHCPEHGLELRFVTPGQSALLNTRPDEFLRAGKVQLRSDRAALAMLPIPSDTLALLLEILRRSATRTCREVVQDLSKYIFDLTKTEVKLYASDRMTHLVQSSTYAAWLDELMPKTGKGKNRSREWVVFSAVLNGMTAGLSAAAIALVASVVVPSHDDRLKVLFG